MTDDDIEPTESDSAAGGNAARRALVAELLNSTPSAWVQEVRFLYDVAADVLAPYHFKGRPYLLDIMDSDARRVVVMKSAQIGMTEVAINWGLHGTIQKGRDVLTVLPKDDMIKAFSMGRVDRAFMESPFLRAVPRATSNPKHKNIRGRNWYLRASNSPSELIEIPVQMVILDEYDRLNPQAPALAEKRMQGCPEHLRREKALSTPTRAGFGIDLEFQHSSRGRWFVPCPHCLEEQALTFDGNIVADEDEAVEPAWKCAKCDAAWTEDERREAVEAGRWIHEFPDRLKTVAGFHITALYSPTETAESIVNAWRRAKRDPDPSKFTEFWNQVLGLPFTASGEALTEGDISAAQNVRRFTMAASSPEKIPVSMGVDQGPSRLHVWVDEWELEHGLPMKAHTAAVYEVTSFEDLDTLMERHNVNACVIDSLPEKRSAVAFQSRHVGLVWLAIYVDRPREMLDFVDFSVKASTAGPLGLRGGFVRIGRTEIIDTRFSRFRRAGGILVPSDLPADARRHLLALYVTEGKDTFNHPVKRYDSGGQPDHYAHAAFYSEAAAARLGDFGGAPIPEEKNAGWDEEV